MKTKLEMAHEYAKSLALNPSVTATHNDDDIVKRSWEYADAMQAKADKHTTTEWKPDWSQAPEWANWWAVDDLLIAWWYNKEPKLGHGGWCIDRTTDYFYKAPSFNYKGNWQDSLEERPNDPTTD